MILVYIYYVNITLDEKKTSVVVARTTLGVCIVVVRQCASYGVDGDIYEKR